MVRTDGGWLEEGEGSEGGEGGKMVAFIRDLELNRGRCGLIEQLFAWIVKRVREGLESWYAYGGCRM